MLQIIEKKPNLILIKNKAPSVTEGDFIMDSVTLGKHLLEKLIIQAFFNTSNKQIIVIFKSI